VIYYLTIHWHSDRWVKLQHEMLKRYTTGDYRVYGFLNGLEPESYKYFDVVRSDADDPWHDEKLDRLAEMVLSDSSNDRDWMIFLDGDAFPVAPIDAQLTKFFEQYPLVAIQRIENMGEQHAHPSFCATTTGFWRKYKPSWRKGYTWTMTGGREETDVGGELLRILDEDRIPWKKLHRSNHRNLHPLLFGIYEDLVYHHGTGFRGGVVLFMDHVAHIETITSLYGKLLLYCVPRKWRMHVRNSVLHPEGRTKRRLSKHNAVMSEKVYEALTKDTDAFLASIR